ncbi:MAG: hypothetical protein JW951_10065 [Lentisphaerae bacterium]|nr:hypothetical protein [Lentisphaerota bacterium]
MKMKRLSIVLAACAVLLIAVDLLWAAPGDTCQEAVVISIPSQLPYVTNDTTCGRINDYDNTCLGNYDSGEDIVYELDVDVDVRISIAVTSETTWAGIALDAVCPLGSMGECLGVAASTANPDVIEDLALTPGSYYLVIDTWSAPLCTDFSLTITRDICAAAGGGSEYISNVTVGAIDNASGSDAYGDYTGQHTVLTTGEQYPITVALGDAQPADVGGLWVDWNQDWDFNDAGETITTAWSGVGPYLKTITPPLNAIAGWSRLRVRVYRSDTDPVPPAPCGDTTYGEVEDYLVRVVRPPAFTQISLNSTQSVIRLTSVGGVTPGLQILQQSTNLLAPGSGWQNILTNIAPENTNFWLVNPLPGRSFYLIKNEF